MREIWDFIVQSKIIAQGKAEGNNFAEDNKITYFSNKGTYLFYHMPNALFVI